MGLGDIVNKDVEKSEHKETESEEGDKDEHIKVAGKSPKEMAEKIRERRFLHEFVEREGIIVEPPEDKEYTTWGDAELQEPLPDGYIDCTDRVEFLGTVTKYLDCPHCDNNLRQRSGSGARRGSTWARCGGCGRILVDLQAGNRNDNGEIVNQSGIDSWM